MGVQEKAPFTPECKGKGDFSNFDDYEEVPLKVAKQDKYAKEYTDFWLVVRLVRWILIGYFFVGFVQNFWLVNIC